MITAMTSRITTIEMIDIVYAFLEAKAIISEISGDMYKSQRPADSKLEDIVINVPTADAEMIQRGVVNVNFHVPNISKMPNHIRIRHLAKKGAALLAEGYGEQFNFWIDGQSIFSDLDADEQIINFRLRFKYHNTNLSTP